MTGKEIAEWRKKNKWSQTKLARAVGTDQSIVSKWERGRLQPPDDIRQQLTKAMASSQRAYEKCGGQPRPGVSPEMVGRNTHDNASERNWRCEYQTAYRKNEAIRQAAEMAADVRMAEIAQELEAQKSTEPAKTAPQGGENEKPEYLPQESEKARTGESDGPQKGKEMEDTRGKCIVTEKQDQKPSEETMQMLEPQKKPRFADIQKTMFCMYQMAGECEGIDGSTEVLLMAQRELARRMENGVVWE